MEKNISIELLQHSHGMLLNPIAVVIVLYNDWLISNLKSSLNISSLMITMNKKLFIKCLLWLPEIK